MPIYGVKDNKSLEEPIKVIEVTIQSGVDYTGQKIKLPEGWTPDNCLILNAFSFNERGNNFVPILEDFIANDDGTFTLNYKNSGNATTAVIVLVKK